MSPGALLFWKRLSQSFEQQSEDKATRCGGQSTILLKAPPLLLCADVHYPAFFSALD